MWSHGNGAIFRNQIAIRSEKTQVVTRCKRPQSVSVLLPRRAFLSGCAPKKSGLRPPKAIVGSLLSSSEAQIIYYTS